MSAHPYIRAYMAGIALPSLFMLLSFSVFCVARFVYNVPFPIERVIVFPLALVPNLWGAWNMLYLATHTRSHLSLAILGSLLPLLLGPSGMAVANVLGFTLPSFFPAGLALGLPVALVFYYLVWKYLVAFLNRLLGIG